MTRAFEVFRALVGNVELLIDYEGDEFAHTGRAREDLLAIIAVHPMRERAVTRFLARAHAPATLLAELVRHGDVIETSYGGNQYYLRPVPAPRACRTRERGHT